MNRTDIDAALIATRGHTDNHTAAFIVHNFLTALIPRANWWQRQVLRLVRGYVAEYLGETP